MGLRGSGLADQGREGCHADPFPLRHDPGRQRRQLAAHDGGVLHVTNPRQRPGGEPAERLADGAGRGSRPGS
jgi:hypothetical protein